MLHCHHYCYHLPLKQQEAENHHLDQLVSLLSLASLPPRLCVWPSVYVLFSSLLLSLSYTHTHTHTHTHTLASLHLGLLVVPLWAVCNRAVRANKRQSSPFSPATSHHSSSLSDSFSPSLCLLLSSSLSLCLSKTGSILHSWSNQALLAHRKNTALQFVAQTNNDSRI